MRAFAQALDGVDLGNRFKQFGLCLSVVDFGALVCKRLFGLALSIKRLGFVKILATDCGIGKHRYPTGLDFEKAASDKDKFFFFLVRNLDSHRARFDPGHQRRVPRQNAKFT